MKTLMAVLLSFTVWSCSNPAPGNESSPGSNEGASPLVGTWRLAARLVPDDNPDYGMIDLPAFPNTITFHPDSNYKNGQFSAELYHFTATDTAAFAAAKLPYPAKLEQLTEIESISGTWSVRGDELTLDDGELAHTYKFGVGNGMLTLIAKIAGQRVDLHYDQAAEL